MSEFDVSLRLAWAIFGMYGLIFGSACAAIWFCCSEGKARES